MGGYTNFGSLDDGTTGDGIGSGFTDSITDYSGIANDSDPIYTSNVTGSDLPLDFSSGATGLGVSDLGFTGSLTDSNSLSGAADTAPSALDDTGEYSLDTNGSGYASSALTSKSALSMSSSGDILSSISAFGKFGASLAGVFSGNHPTMIGGVPIGAPGSIAYNSRGVPINAPASISTGISANHTTAIIAVVLGLAALLLFLPGARRAVA